MNIESMRAFLEIAATGSFQNAAERLNITQSAISARIKGLEQRLNRVLLARKRSGIELTDAGCPHSDAPQGGGDPLTAAAETLAAKLAGASSADIFEGDAARAAAG